ncbi:MAG: hypothetical protein R2712_07840 [Vicinamibacterales bacterium]
MMVPGATLPPGTYVMEFVEGMTANDVIQIRHEGGDVVTTAMVVPIKRANPKGEIVLQFTPTEAGSPPAIRGWFYPASIYGHQFIYPADQARQIANRTKTVVLSTDQQGTDMRAGRLVVFDQSGSSQAYEGDAATTKEWQDWRNQRNTDNANANRDSKSAANANDRSAASSQRSGQSTQTDRGQNAVAVSDSDDKSTALAMETKFRGERVKLDDIEDEPMKFVGRTVSVDAEVEKVYGPRLFTIDEPNWMDFDGEVLVHAPNALAALVREGDRVTVTGQIKGFAAGDVENEWGWMGLDPDDPEAYRDKPLLEASRIVGGDSDLVLLINAADNPGAVEGTRSANSRSMRGHDERAVTDAGQLAAGGDELIGRHVSLSGVRVNELADAHGGFYARGGDQAVFVLPSAGTSAEVASGDSVTIEGIVLRAPRNMALEGDMPDDTNDDIYVLATGVTR